MLSFNIKTLYKAPSGYLGPYKIIQLYDISSMSDILNYLIIQLFDISSMSDILNHLIIHLSNISDC